MKSRFIYFLPPFLLFAFFGIITLGHYGVSWDEPEHFLRGQGYLRLFLTGKTNYDGLPKYDLARAREDPGYHERSYYQTDSYGAETWFVYDKGHPPLNDIIASFTNYIFYQKFGLLGDIEGYHLFNILISAVLVGTVFLFAKEAFGIWPASFTVFFLATYPLFWAESHFNIKDPAQTAFFVLTLYFFWKAFNKRKTGFIFISSMFAGFALSVKFNIVFLPFIVIPWLTILFLSKAKVHQFAFVKKTLLAFLLFPAVMAIILIASWPFLWQDLLGNTLSVFGYYRELGTEEKISFNLLSGWNIYAPRWILYTTPPFTLLAFLAGFVALGRIWSKRNSAAVLWLLLFLIPILRVSFPGTSIYGGVRQIMEYIPGIALLAGVGANYIRGVLLALSDRLKVERWVTSLIFFLAVALVGLYPLYRLHPNENAYFNFLSGGLQGAIERGIPAAGNSYGNAYFQGIEWLNKNAPNKSVLALVQGTTLNVPFFQLRPDIDFSNNYWSGIERRGEYLMELTYNQEFRMYFYAWEYAEKMLEPIYQVKADGVPILTIWKNDLEHTKPEYQRTETFYSGPKEIKKNGNTILIKVPTQVTLSRLVMYYVPSEECILFKSGYVETSLDGQSWIREKDPVAVDQLPKGGLVKVTSGEKFFQYPFTAREVKFIRVVSYDPNVCILHNTGVDLIIFQ